MSEQLAVFIDFENVALWAEQEFLDFELTPLMEYLKSRGPIAFKRAYGDWSRFSRYREELMNNAIDLVQIYSIRVGKNRADIRMAIDAIETAITRDKIGTFVIVSGDSDFGPLVSKLREYSRYTLGIGPRDVTHPLLVKACDEFVYLESVLWEMADGGDLSDQPIGDNETARSLLMKALRV
ncbi:MAG: NYN domain-containing protein, partial [Caldilineaceae bacterium]|nr:NYN domain-containing protein [Caldilineaceae bacterium]